MRFSNGLRSFVPQLNMEDNTESKKFHLFEAVSLSGGSHGVMLWCLCLVTSIFFWVVVGRTYLVGAGGGEGRGCPSSLCPTTRVLL